MREKTDSGSTLHETPHSNLKGWSNPSSLNNPIHSDDSLSFCDNMNVPAFLFIDPEIFQVAGFVAVEALLVRGTATGFRVAAATVLAIRGLAIGRLSVFAKMERVEIDQGSVSMFPLEHPVVTSY
jgi:hypothetical protein